MSMIEPRPAEKRGCWAANWERDAVLLLDCAALPPLAGFADKPQPMMKKPRGSRRGAWGCLLSTCRPPLPGDFEAAHAGVYKPPYPFCRRDFAEFLGVRLKLGSPVNLHRCE